MALLEYFFTQYLTALAVVLSFWVWAYLLKRFDVRYRIRQLPQKQQPQTRAPKILTTFSSYESPLLPSSVELLLLARIT